MAQVVETLEEIAIARPTKLEGNAGNIESPSLAFCFSLLLASLAASRLNGFGIKPQAIADFIQTCAAVACGGKSGIPDDVEGLTKHVSVGPPVKICLWIEFGGWLGAPSMACGEAIEFYPKPMKVMKVSECFIQAILVATSYLVGIGIGFYAAALKPLVEFLKCRRLQEYLKVMVVT